MIREQRMCPECDRWFDPVVVPSSVPTGLCSVKCSADRKRRRAQDRAARRRVPPRAPSRLFSPSSRDWTEARAKVDAEGSCRVCLPRGPHKVEAAHIVPRSTAANGAEDPRNIVPLCREHHAQYDAGKLNLLSWLSPNEQAYAVELAGSIVAAMRVISGKRNGGGVS